MEMNLFGNAGKSTERPLKIGVFSSGHEYVYFARNVGCQDVEASSTRRFLLENQHSYSRSAYLPIKTYNLVFEGTPVELRMIPQGLDHLGEAVMDSYVEACKDLDVIITSRQVADEDTMLDGLTIVYDCSTGVPKRGRPVLTQYDIDFIKKLNKPFHLIMEFCELDDFYISVKENHDIASGKDVADFAELEKLLEDINTAEYLAKVKSHELGYLQYQPFIFAHPLIHYHAPDSSLRFIYDHYSHLAKKTNTTMYTDEDIAKANQDLLRLIIACNK